MSPHIFAFERLLPAWIRPTSRGAVCILGLGVGVAGKCYVGALVVSLVLLVGVRNGVVLFFSILGVTVLAGAVGGTIHGLLRRLDGWGRVGSWLRWVAALLAAFAAMVLLTPSGPLSLREPAFWIMAGGIAMLGAGSMVLLDARRPGRLTPHQFRWLANRDQRWSATAISPLPRRRPRMTRGSVAIRRWPALSRAARWWRTRRNPAAGPLAVRQAAP